MLFCYDSINWFLTKNAVYRFIASVINFGIRQEYTIQMFWIYLLLLFPPKDLHFLKDGVPIKTMAGKLDKMVKLGKGGGRGKGAGWIFQDSRELHGLVLFD